MRKGAQSSVGSWTGFLPFNESVDHEVEAFEPEEIDFPPPEILLLDPSSYLRYPAGLKAADLSIRCDILCFVPFAEFRFFGSPGS